MPEERVLKKSFSSFSSINFILEKFSNSALKSFSSKSLKHSKHSCKKGDLRSILYPCRTALLITLLKTYPLPSFEGTTFSDIRKKAALR